MKIPVIALNSLRRLFRDRTALFFVILLPGLIIFLIGITIFGAGGSGGIDTAQVGILDQAGDSLSKAIVSKISADEHFKTSTYQDLEVLQQDIRRETIDAGVVIPTSYQKNLESGRTVEVTFVSPAVDPAPTVRSLVASLLADQGAKVRAAVFATDNGTGTFHNNLEVAEEESTKGDRVTVKSEVVGKKIEEDEDAYFGGFQYPAASNLVLFIFITSLAGSSQLIETRQLGIARKMLGTPTRASTVLFGTALGRFSIAAFQGLFIFTLGTVAFGVVWGDLWGAAALILAFCLVATGFGMLAGTVFRTPEQAGAVGPPVGIALGMLGGCMWPLEIVPEVMRTAGHITPHAWAMDGFVDLIIRGDSAAGIIPQLAVLVGIAAVILPLSTWRLRKAVIT